MAYFYKNTENLLSLIHLQIDWGKQRMIFVWMQIVKQRKQKIEEAEHFITS
jgi:hypothetical protein